MESKDNRIKKEEKTFMGIIVPTFSDFKAIVAGETTVGFKYDGIGTLFMMLPMLGIFISNVFFTVSKAMLWYYIIASIVTSVLLPISIIIKDAETYVLRRGMAIIGSIALSLCWFFTGGIYSPTGYIWMAMSVAYSSFLVTGKKGKYYVSHALIWHVAAMIISTVFPNLLVPMENESNLIIHNWMGIVLVCIYIGLTTWFQRKIAENLQTELANKNEEIQKYMASEIEMKLKEEELKQEKKHADEMTVLLIHTLSDTIEARDEYTRGHSNRVSQYAVLIAEKMGLSEEQISRIKDAANLHDVGKIGISDMILNKPSRLTDEEYNTIKTHTTIGSDLLKKIDVISYTSDIARHHHERFDGKGYPDGLKGEEITLESRIVAVADSFDAMNSKRVYRTARDKDYIRTEIERNKGLQFSPEVVEAFLELFDSGAFDLVA